MPVTFDEYQKKALSTAIDEGSELEQRVLGLVGESGEIADKIKKWYRDDGGDINKLNKEELAKELGDVLWYVAAFADYLGYSLNEIATSNMEKLSDREKRDKLTGRGDNR
jgi:NTP pyrophosphatase (non-canonical NTP hydrolase)